MTLRKARAEDVERLVELWCHAFPGRTVAERTRQLRTGEPFGGLDDTWLEEQAGRIAGAFRAYRFTQFLDAEPVAITGLASVAVATWARRKGLGRLLCEQAIRIGRERGDLLSLLYPFRPDFYQAMGWGFAGHLLSYRFRPEALPAYDEARRVVDAGPSDHADIAACYERVASGSHGPLRRRPPIWAKHLGAPATRPFIYVAGSGVQGYLLARFGRGQVPGERLMRIAELVAENEAAYQGLLGWVSAQRDQWRRVRYDARPDEGLGDRLHDPRPPGFRLTRGLWFPTATVLQGPMLRLLDVPRALEARRRWGEERGVALTIEIEVDDDEVPANRGPWHLILDEGGPRVHPAAGPGADASLAAGASTFARIFVGGLAPTTAGRLGLARLGGATDVLDRVFQVSPAFWLADEF